jgi:hypothetical protein
MRWYSRAVITEDELDLALDWLCHWLCDRLFYAHRMSSSPYRYPVQLCLSHGSLIVLANDQTLWWLNTDNTSRGWTRLPDLPDQERPGPRPSSVSDQMTRST